MLSYLSGSNVKEKEMKNNSKAIIVSMSAHGERLPAAAGRISTGKGTATEILSKSFDVVKNANLIKKVNASGHNSTLEHTYYNVAFEDVSVFAEQFIIEFRLASFTVKSRRYVDFSDSGYYIPELTEEQRAVYTEIMDKCYSVYSELCDADIPKEDARFLLPYSLHSNIICSLNAREALRMIRAMVYGRGKNFAEIKMLGEQLLSQIKMLTPGIADTFVAPDEIYDMPHFDFARSNVQNSEKVVLLTKTDNAPSVVARTALICDGYSDLDADTILADKKNIEDCINAVIKSDRPRALENAVYTFRINGVSLSTITHFTRHRMQSLLVPSLVTTDRKKYIIPDTVKNNLEILEKYKSVFADMAVAYDKLKAMGVSDENLVYVQMSGNVLDIVSTMNARQLLLFFRLRTCNRAQWEVREYAQEMLRILKKTDPEIFKFYGPSCCLSACPEGRMSCGQAAQMRQKWL